MDMNLIREIYLLHEQVCDALSSPIRIMILYALSHQSRYVIDLAAELDLPQPTVSRHLKVLRERGLVTARREGPSVYYALGDERIIDALELMRGVLRDRLLEQTRLTDQRA